MPPLFSFIQKLIREKAGRTYPTNQKQPPLPVAVNAWN